jgi:hypothetical protein
MKRQQAEQCNATPLPGEADQQCRDENRTRPPVEQIMMKMLIVVIIVFFAGYQRASEIRDYAESVRIRKNSGQRYKLAIARVSRGGGRDQPAAEEMGERRH